MPQLLGLWGRNTIWEGPMGGRSVLGENRQTLIHTGNTRKTKMAMMESCHVFFLFFGKKEIAFWNDIVVCPLSCWFSEVYMFRKKKLLRGAVVNCQCSFQCQLVLIYILCPTLLCLFFCSVVPTRKSILRVGMDCKDSQSAATPDSQDGPL